MYTNIILAVVTLHEYIHIQPERYLHISTHIHLDIISCSRNMKLLVTKKRKSFFIIIMAIAKIGNPKLLIKLLILLIIYYILLKATRESIAIA